MHKSMPSLITLISLLALFNPSLIAQKITPDWINFHKDKEYGSRLIVNSFVNDSNGNSYLLGHTANEPTNYDIILLGISSSGDTIFNKTNDNKLYPGSRDLAHRIHMDSSDNLIVVGKTQWNDSNIYGDPLIQKYNTNGELLWSTVHRPQEEVYSQNMMSIIGNNDTIYLINRDAMGKRYLENISPDGQHINSLLLSDGNSQANYHMDASSKQLYIYDSKELSLVDFNGNTIWDYPELFKHEIHLSGILVDSNNNCFLYGGNVNYENGNYYYHIIKLSSNGQVLWEKKIVSNAYRSVCQKAILDNNGGITVAYQNNTQTLIGDIHILNINSSGTQTKEFDINLLPDEGKWKEFKNICYDSNGNLGYAVLNCSEHPNYDSSIKKLEIGKYSAQGELQWNKKFDDTPGTSLIGPFILTSDAQNNLKLSCNKEFSRNTALNYTTDEESLFVVLSENGDMTASNNMQGESFSKITAHSVSYDSKDSYTVVCESDLCKAETKIIAVRYDTEGNKLWEYNYLHPDKFSLKHIKTYTLTNGFVKILLEARGRVDGNYVDKHIVLTIDNDGNEHLQTELDIPYYPFTASDGFKNHYYLEYWQNNIPYLSCFDATDKIKWTKVLNDDSFINDASINGVDKDDNVYLYASGNLSKVDTTGNILWTTTIGDVDHVGARLVLDKEKNVYLYRNEEKHYHYQQLGLYKLSEAGELQWSFKSDTIVGGHVVWPHPDGGVSVFGELMRYAYGDSYSLSTVLSINKNGVQENRLDLTVYSYGNKPILSGDKVYISHQNGLVVFDKNGKYLASPTFDNLSLATSEVKTKDMAFDNAHNAVAINEISIGGYYNQDWAIMALTKFDTQFLGKQENTAPYFVNVEDTINNTIYYENYSNTAIDKEGDPIIYTMVSDDCNIYGISPQTGHIKSRYSSSSPKRGIHNLVIRASDPHGAYSDQKRVIVIGPDNKPFFVTTPTTTCRVGSKYTYNPIVIDEDKDPLTYSLVNTNADWLSIDENTGQLTGTPPENAQSTTVDITIEAYEATFNHHVQQSFNLSIEERNTPPTIHEINTIATLNQMYKQDLHYFDAEDDHCEWEVLEIPDWLDFDPNTNTIYGTPSKSDFYSDGTLILQLTDSYQGVTSMTYEIKIEHPGNQAPVFISDPIEQAYTNLEYIYLLDAYDPDGEKISYETIVLPAFISLINDSILKGRPDELDEDYEHSVVVQATDYFGKSTLQEYTLTVSPEAEGSGEHPFDLQYAINKDKTELEITLSGVITSSVEISVFDYTGKRIAMHVNQDVANGKVSQVINTLSWTKGEYLLSVSVGGKQMIKKITIN